MASSSMLSSTQSLHLLLRRRPTNFRRISASKLPSPPPPTPPGQAYQPFRPPPTPLPPKYRSLSPIERLDVLRDRLGLWYEYAPLVSYLLTHEGFTPPIIEEATGITGVEQNRLAVGAQVRDSLISSFDPDLLAYFDSYGSAELLYELRFLNAAQRSASARYVAIGRLDPKSTQELARAVKDFPYRRGEDGWTSFSADSPGDCLAFTYFRLSREAITTPDRLAALEKALDSVETESGKSRIEGEIEKVSKRGDVDVDGEEEEEVKVSIPVVRLRYGEVAEASSVALIPVVSEQDGEEGVEAAPAWCKAEGEMGVVAAEKGWGRWVVLPGWGPVAALECGVAVEFGDAKVFPWGIGKYEKEAVVAVVDRRRRSVEEAEGLYLVAGKREEKGKGCWLGMERGKELMEKGIRKSLGIVVLVVRPPKEEQFDQLSDEDWE